MTGSVLLLGLLLLLAWTVLALVAGWLIGRGTAIADEHEQAATLPIEGRETRWDALA